MVGPSTRKKIKDLIGAEQQNGAVNQNSMSVSSSACPSISAPTVEYRVISSGNNCQVGDASGVQISPLNGQFYVLGSPTDMLGTVTARGVAPRLGAGATLTLESSAGGSGRVEHKDNRRKATHNEVERRRRDSINIGIMKLAKLIPSVTASSAGSSAGQAKGSQSKGGILTKACDFVTDLRTANQRLTEKVRERDLLVKENAKLIQQLEELRGENAALKDMLQANGVEIPPSDFEESMLS